MSTQNVTPENRQIFNDLLEKIGNIKKGSIMSGVVMMEDNYSVFVDLGLKAYGKIPKEEFYIDDKKALPKQGEVIPVLLESLEDLQGNIVISYSKAQRQSKWGTLEQYCQKRTSIEGVVMKKVHGGCIVRILDISAFLPKTHFPNDVKDPKDLLKRKLNCTIIKMDANKSNIVVSAKNSNDMEILSTFSTGQIVQGIVKSISESYALIELGSGINGKLHIREISWSKIDNISDVLTVGETLQVKIISDGSRVDLSLREVDGKNPWLKRIEELGFAKDQIVTGTINKIEEKILFVKFNEEVSGSLHLNEVAWNRKYQNFNEFAEGKEITTRVIDINSRNNRLVLSIKRLQENSFDQFKIGSTVIGKITGLSELGYIVHVQDKLDGIIPNSSYYVEGTLQTDQEVTAYVHSVDNSQLILGTKAPK
ncbi:S1 RNA-binding domain-containing protein [Alphaproteobacteria bacterium endosymbiont of Tiliacea citrago]|uniref:S1 RNA-binding domain-containing protein n=1 Tax=Alphaproteobacteria bacterium endosymbiont of Tiliacea citrago TaxID=3077944 RepID=UPI00313AC3FD